jgi:hypothetical protein
MLYQTFFILLFALLSIFGCGEPARQSQGNNSKGLQEQKPKKKGLVEEVKTPVGKPAKEEEKPSDSLKKVIFFHDNEGTKKDFMTLAKSFGLPKKNYQTRLIDGAQLKKEIEETNFNDVAAVVFVKFTGQIRLNRPKFIKKIIKAIAKKTTNQIIRLVAFGTFADNQKASVGKKTDFLNDFTLPQRDFASYLFSTEHGQLKDWDEQKEPFNQLKKDLAKAIAK